MADQVRPPTTEELRERLDDLRPAAQAYGESAAQKRERLQSDLRTAGFAMVANALGTLLAAGIIYALGVVSGLLDGVEWLAAVFLVAMGAIVIGGVAGIIRQARTPKEITEFRQARAELRRRELARKIADGERLTKEEQQIWAALQLGIY